MVFFVFSTFYIIGLIDCIGYHGGNMDSILDLVIQVHHSQGYLI
jgi:hypothetical protein